MLGNMNSSYSSLSEEQRASLTEYLTVHKEYLEASLKLDSLRITALANPTQANEEAMRTYTSTVVAPIRTKMGSMAKGLIEESIDTDKLMEMLPMVLMALTGAINLPLLLNTFNIEPDRIESTIGKASSYFKRGM